MNWDVAEAGFFFGGYKFAEELHKGNTEVILPILLLIACTIIGIWRSR